MEKSKMEKKLERKAEFLKGFKLSKIEKTIQEVLESRNATSLGEVDSMFHLLKEMIEYIYGTKLTIDQIDKSENKIHYKIFALGEEVADFELVKTKKINTEKLEEDFLEELSDVPDEVKEMLLNFVGKLQEKLK